MRESVPTARYSPVCNVLRQWKTSLILTYRVYRLYDISESRSRDGSTPCRRVFRAVGSVPGLTKEAYCHERADGAKFPKSYA